MKYDVYTLYTATVTELYHVTNHYHLVRLYDVFGTIMYGDDDRKMTGQPTSANNQASHQRTRVVSQLEGA